MTLQVVQQEAITLPDLETAIHTFTALDEELEARQHRGIYWTSPDENKLIAEWKHRLNGGTPK